MADTGHAKNVENFATLISFVGGYGAAYDPSNPALVLAALNAKLTAAQTAMDDVATGKAGWKVKVKERENEYEGVRKLATRVVNAFSVSADVSDNDIEDLKAIKRKIDGARAEALPPDDPETPEDESQGNSVSQRSYTYTAQFFNDMIQFVKSFAGYVPNETELQWANLGIKHAAMEAANAAVLSSLTGLSNDRLSRNTVLYHDETGLYELAGDVKKYVKSVFGPIRPSSNRSAALNLPASAIDRGPRFSAKPPRKPAFTPRFADNAKRFYFIAPRFSADRPAFPAIAPSILAKSPRNLAKPPHNLAIAPRILAIAERGLAPAKRVIVELV